MQGGPNWVRNFVDSPVKLISSNFIFPKIIVNAETDEFYKQPMFYALAHFRQNKKFSSQSNLSRFIPPGSVRIKTEWIATEMFPVEAVAFRTPSGDRVLVLVSNSNDEELEIVVEEAGGTRNVHFTLIANSIATLIWAKEK